MLYGKIYFDVIDGQETIVFTSLSSDEEYRAKDVDRIAISPEARELLLSCFNAPEMKPVPFFGDFEFIGGNGREHGSFFFKPTTEENGLMHRMLRKGDPFVVICRCGHSRNVIHYMIPCDNAYLKELNLLTSVDEDTLWERHFAAMRARGEEPGCDADTIKRTPTEFLTEAQKDIIRKDYRYRCDGYSSQEWHIHGDFLEDKIIGEITVAYCKGRADIEGICRSAHR